MEHSNSPSGAASPRGNSSSNTTSPREKRKFTTETGEEWEFTRPSKRLRATKGPTDLTAFFAGSNTSIGISSGSPPRNQRLPSIPAARGKRSRDPSDQDSDIQPPSPKRQRTSVPDLGADATRPNTRGWLKEKRKAEARRARSPSAGSTLHGISGSGAGSGATQSPGPVEVELPDYESDEEQPAIDLATRPDDTLEQLAPLQEPAMTFPPADNFQEGQESAMPVVESIELDHDVEASNFLEELEEEMEVEEPSFSYGPSGLHVTGSDESHQDFVAAVHAQQEAAATAGNLYGFAGYARPVTWQSRVSRSGDSSSRSPSPATKYLRARANRDSSSSSTSSQPQRRFGGFGRPAVMASTQQSTSLDELISHMASEPGNTSSSAIMPGPVTAAASRSQPASEPGNTSSSANTPGPVTAVASASPADISTDGHFTTEELNAASRRRRVPTDDLDPNLSPVRQFRRAPTELMDPDLSPVRQFPTSENVMASEQTAYPNDEDMMPMVRGSIASDEDDHSASEPKASKARHKLSSQQRRSVDAIFASIEAQDIITRNLEIAINDELASEQLLFELQKYATDPRNLYQQEEVVSAAQATPPPQPQPQPSHQNLHHSESALPSATSATLSATGASLSHVPINSINPQTSSLEEEPQSAMAVHAVDGPNEEEMELLRLVMEELNDDMDIDNNQDHSDQFISKQNEIRERQRRKNDREAKIARAFTHAQSKIQADRMRLDEAPDIDLEEPQIINDQDIDDNVYDFHVDHIPNSSEAVQARLQTALEHWNTKHPNPRSLSTQYWQNEARTSESHEQIATSAAESSYWSSRKHQAQFYIKGELSEARNCNTFIRLALIAWIKAVASSQEEAAGFAEKVSKIHLEDPEAAVRAKFARFLEQLPPDLDKKVTDILNISNPSKQVATSVDGVALTRKDFATLVESANYHTNGPEGWLNDEIINGFFSALCHSLNEKAGWTKGKIPPFAAYATAWFETAIKSKRGATGIQTWSRRKGIKGDKLLQCKRIFFPLNPGNHWTLLVISPEDHTIEYLDSLDSGTSKSPRKSDSLAKFARDWLKMELGTKYVDDEWTVIDRRSSQQNNGADCGVFTCLNGAVSALGLSNPANEFGPKQIPHARRALVSMFDIGGFKDYFEL